MEVILYLLLNIEAWLNAQVEILIEITDILTRKDLGQTEHKYLVKMANEYKEVLVKMSTDKNIINSIKQML